MKKKSKSKKKKEDDTTEKIIGIALGILGGLTLGYLLERSPTIMYRDRFCFIFNPSRIMMLLGIGIMMGILICLAAIGIGVIFE